MTTSTMISLERIGRRTYFRGDTYAAKNRLRAEGAKWDPDTRAWWIGSDDKAKALLQLIADDKTAAQSASPTGATAAPGVTDDTTLEGKARYKGRDYLLLWLGPTKRGEAAKLASSDGKLVFWADAKEVDIVKRYAVREGYRGRRDAMTFGTLVRLRERYAEGRKQGYADGIPKGHGYRCEECDERVVRGDGSHCWETGIAH